MRILVPTLLAASLTAAAALPASAQDNSLMVGVTRYTTDSKSNGISGVGVPPGADARTGDATTLLLVYERALTPRLSGQLVLGIPPRIEARATGSVAFLGDGVLSARNVSPTLIAKYYLADPGARWRPYLGAGINFTRFVDIRSTLADDVKMKDSTGWVLEAGVAYAIDPRWGLFGSVARLDVKSEVVAVGATVLTTKIDFRPVTYSFGAYYRF
ncbi:MAG: OmpW family protein [Burkholderiales bacterium]|nr:OmpW family protein [Burkholderiales bacterium]